MRGLLLGAVLMTATACFNSGAYQAALETSIKALHSVITEQNLTDACELAAHQQIEDSKTEEEAKSRVAAVMARCDYSWKLYRRLQQDQEALIAALQVARQAQMEGQDDDEGGLVALMVKVEADIAAFERSVAAVGDA